jgi:hypothetical protein
MKADRKLVAGWFLLAGNLHARADRLAQLGWEPEWSRREDMMALMPAMVEAAIASIDAVGASKA